MIKIYGTKTCPDCAFVEAGLKSQEAGAPSCSLDGKGC